MKGLAEYWSLVTSAATGFDFRSVLPRGWRLLVLFLLSVPSIAAGAVPNDISARFDAANKLYEQGKFPEAASAYQVMTRSGAIAPALYYNLGNAWFKSGETGRALQAYLEAERLAPRDPDIAANLQFVRGQVQGPTLVRSRWERELGRLSLNEWTLLACSALWVWLLFLALGQLRPAWKPSLRTVTFLSLAGVIVLGICLAGAVVAASTQGAIVTANEAAVRNGPLEESPVTFTVHDGAELTVLDRKNDWLQVTAGERRIGWIKQGQVILRKG